MLAQLKHGLLVSWRSFGKYKGSFFINLVGLSTGITAALLIFFWIQSELSMNKFNEKDDQLYQIMENRTFADRIVTAESTSGPLAEALKAGFPAVETATTVAPAFRFGKVILSVGEKKIKSTCQYASQDYFKVFTFHALAGDLSSSLMNPKSIVLTESLAAKLFSTPSQALGRQVNLQGEQSTAYQVSAVIALPDNFSEPFDFVLPLDVLIEQWPGLMSWGNTAPNTYILLKKGSNLAQFNRDIANLVKQNSEDKHRTLFAKRYADQYLYGKYENGVQTGGRIEYVRLLGIIALFILLIACINFMNLATARASRRIKEIGVKKAVGATNKALSTQFLMESFLMTLIAFIIALLLVSLLIHPFSQLTGKQLTLAFNLTQGLTMLGIVILVSLIAGSYPAVYLSHLKVLQTLKGKLQHHLGEVLARKGLVVFQFTLSVMLMISVIVVYQQIHYIQTADLGYQRDQVITLEKEESTPITTLLHQIKSIPGVRNASALNFQLDGHHTGTEGLEWEGKDPNSNTEFENMPVYYGLTETLGMEMNAGRFFSPDFGADSSKIIFNEAAIDFMGLQHPIGKTVRLWGEERQIIGVVKDFHFESFHERIKPLFMLLNRDPGLLAIKLEAGKTQQALDGIKKIYQQYHPGIPFDYQFMDTSFAAQYQAETRVSALSRYFAVLAILISCLGLFGLASFTAERRQKEISIRKVLGASIGNLSTLLSVEFLSLVLIAIGIAIPVAWYLTHKWLNDFAYHISISWWIFALAGLLAMLITILTVGFQAIKTALANPVESLRNE